MSPTTHMQYARYIGGWCAIRTILPLSKVSFVNNAHANVFACAILCYNSGSSISYLSLFFFSLLSSLSHRVLNYTHIHIHRHIHRHIHIDTIKEEYSLLLVCSHMFVLVFYVSLFSPLAFSLSPFDQLVSFYHNNRSSTLYLSYVHVHNAFITAFITYSNTNKSHLRSYLPNYCFCLFSLYFICLFFSFF